ncbi:unnamed protein product [Heterobilharzia americana]|nr:unnamed protein product [Heterobilharzia americana]
MSTLTSGLGESSGILSETSCCSQSQDCLFPTDIVTKPSTMLLFADKDYKRNVSIDCRVLNNFCQTSVSSLNSDVKRTSRLLETNDPKNLNSVAPETMSISSKCNTSHIVELGWLLRLIASVKCTVNLPINTVNG